MLVSDGRSSAAIEGAARIARSIGATQSSERMACTTSEASVSTRTIPHAAFCRSARSEGTAASTCGGVGW